MAECIKTGCDVFIEELGATVRADLFKISTQNNDIVIIVHFNPRSFSFKQDGSDGDVKVIISDGFFAENSGYLIAPIENFDSRIFNYTQR